MEIRSVELRRVELEPLVPLRSANGLIDRRQVSIVIVRTDRATGYGECDALDEPTYNEEFARGAELVLGDHLIPRLLEDDEVTSVTDAMTRLDAVRGNSMAKAAIEMALLDASLREQEQSLASLLGSVAPAVKAGATIGIADVQSVLSQVAIAEQHGYERVKIKIDPTTGAAGLRAVKAHYPQLSLVADANASLHAEHDRELLAELAELELVGLEQPLEVEDLEGHARLVANLHLPVILDESITGLVSLERALLKEAMIGVSVKPARLSGLLRARAIVDRCLECAIGCCIGGMLESGIARAAAIALGSGAGFSLPGDLGASDRYYVTDLTAPHVLIGGELAVPQGAGLGVEVDARALEELTVAKRTFFAP